MQQVLKLKRFLAPRPPREERCQLCASAMPGRHSHLVDLDKHGLLCICRPCYLLFLHPGSAGGKFRAVPERYVNVGTVPSVPLPVGLAFFFFSSAAGRMVALYPSPGGATESALSLDAWSDAVEQSPLLGAMEPDVEALLVRTQSGRAESYIVPIDACYELVGRIRRRWRGFHGGEEVRQEIEAFFEDVRGRSAESVAS